MPNKNYEKGRRREYQIIKQLKEQGFTIAQRTAGSHSPIDILAIHRLRKLILFIQAKAGSEEYEKASKTKAMIENRYLNEGLWNVRFEVR